MYAVYDGKNRLIHGPTTLAEAYTYIGDAGIVCDTTDWIVLPIEMV